MINKILEYILGHERQTRGRNMYGISTYRKCLRCGKTQCVEYSFYAGEKWIYCNPIQELDDQFDEKNNFIL